jgi:Ca2+-binding RTX toxin-like protein
MTVFVGPDYVSADESYTLLEGQYKLLLIDHTQVDGVWVGYAINGYGNELDNLLDGNTAANLLEGNAGNDTIYAGGGSDTVRGGDGNDRIFAGDDIYWAELDVDHLFGGAGRDTLDGGLGADSMSGGTGNDNYKVDDAQDIVTELAGEGIDDVYATIDYTLPDHVEELEVRGTATIGIGNILDNFISGNEFGNLLDGKAGADELEGAAGNDTLIGGQGNDTLIGGQGRDRLTGGGGSDVLLFDTRLNASRNVDSIAGFVAKDDTIQLENAVFSRFTTEGATLSAANFKANAAGVATDRNDFIVYDTVSGKLFYDADGNGAGAAVQFATLVGAPAITAADFLVI